jgi:predicted ATP-dependent endonuclease of OLD family
MFIKELIVKNYRTLEDVSLNFSHYYTAICGKNNAGKSNILKTIRNLLSSGYFIRIISDEFIGHGDINYKNDFTKWKKGSNEDIQIKISIELDKDEDSSLYMFIRDLILKKDETENQGNQKEILCIDFYKKPDNSSDYKINFGEIAIEKDLPKREVLRRIKTSETIVFHNSTENDSFSPFSSRKNSINNFITEKDKKDISDKIETVLKSVQKSLKKQQDELSNLLGRLEDKYEVSFSMQGLKLERESIEISLKEKGVDVSLDEWGSGTKNRTLIFMSLLNARKFQDSSNQSEKIYPIVLIEEPESFLHPSAQAEFGRILQDLANEFKIQVIVTTHSPYLLSHKAQLANILVERDLKSKAKDKGSVITNTEDDNWYEPFALALGINGEDFGPLKSTIFNDSNNVVLVEGPIDKEYFELLKDPIHGSNALKKNVEIYPYGGADVIKNTAITSFIKNRFTNVVVTVDYDKYESIKKSLTSIGFVENKNLLPVGKNEKGKKLIEGLLPSDIKNTVRTNYPDLVDAAMENSNEKKEAQNSLKRKYLEEFKIAAKPGEFHYGEFYKLIKKINSNFK